MTMIRKALMNIGSTIGVSRNNRISPEVSYAGLM